MKCYQLLFGLLIAGMFLAVSIPVKGVSLGADIELEEATPPTPTQCKVLKVAANEVQISYPNLYDGFLHGAVTITDLPNDYYCVVYGQGASDFIILNLEEE
jgi:hypothetical protein